MKASVKQKERKWTGRPLIKLHGEGTVEFVEVDEEMEKLIKNIWNSLVKRGVIV